MTLNRLCCRFKAEDMRMKEKTCEHKGKLVKVSKRELL